MRHLAKNPNPLRISIAVFAEFGRNVFEAGGRDTITTDYRDVLGEVLRERIGHPDPASVFADPSYVARPVGIF